MTDVLEPGADLHQVVEVALAREAALLSAGELRVAERILALDADARSLYARLTLRVGPVFRVGGLRYGLDVPGAVGRLADAGLVHTTLPDAWCASAFDADALRAACRRLGLPGKGRREELVARLAGLRWVEEPVVMPGHRALIARLELFYFQRPWLDRGQLVVERLGLSRWPTYTPTGGPGLFPDRRAMTTWERARRGEWVDDGEPLRLSLAGARPVGLCPWRDALEAVLATDPPSEVLGALLGAGAPVRPRLALRLEAEGRPAEALACCLGDADPVDAVALERTGRRLARSLRRPMPPRPPLARPAERHLRLPEGPKAQGRPTWRVGEADLPVEAAVIACLAAAGRRAVHAENWLWTSLYALVFRDLYWLPVPGMLPSPRRAGPLDVGTPLFWENRREAVEARLREVAAEGTKKIVEGHKGERLEGLAGADLARSLAIEIPGPTTAAVLTRLVREGWRAARGLPDLYVFGGAASRVEGAIPGKVGERDFFAEVKGPTDALRDEQRVWHGFLVENGIPVELWWVAPGSVRCEVKGSLEAESGAVAGD